MYIYTFSNFQRLGGTPKKTLHHVKINFMNIKNLYQNALKIRVKTETKEFLCFGLDFFSVGKVTLYMGDYNLEVPTNEIKNIEYIG